MRELTSHVPFAESVKGAPEFNQPFVSRTLNGTTEQWPLQLVESVDGPHGKVVFEGHSPDDSESVPHFVKISYEAPYGLKVKRTLLYRKTSESGLFLLSNADVVYSFGDVDVSYNSSLSFPIVTDSSLEDPNAFQAAICVTAAGNQQIPPIALMRYDFDPQQPLDARFACADYEEALKGEVERRNPRWRQPSYQHNFFGWEHLGGASVGLTKYDNVDYPDNPNYYGWNTSINSRKPVELKGSPYTAKISRSRARIWGEGRLRFSRINSETRESWMFSVPEWMNISKFHKHIENASLIDFLYQYPVVFCVKSPSIERKWFSTFYTNDAGGKEFFKRSAQAQGLSLAQPEDGADQN